MSTVHAVILVENVSIQKKQTVAFIMFHNVDPFYCLCMGTWTEICLLF